MGEQWKDIEGYEGRYKISNFGNVWSVKNSRLRTITCDRGGYSHIHFWKNGKYHPFRIHRLVAKAFIPNPENKCDVNHKNGIKSDNRVENLEWVTRSENCKHAYDTGLKIFTSKTREAVRKRNKARRTLSTEDVIMALFLRNTFQWGSMKIAAYLNLSEGAIRGLIYANSYSDVKREVLCA